MGAFDRCESQHQVPVTESPDVISSSIRLVLINVLVGSLRVASNELTILQRRTPLHFGSGVHGCDGRI
jgi:hypothetical protein